MTSKVTTGKRHSIPREMQDLADNLRDCDYVESVGLSKFCKNYGSRNPGIKIQFYDSSSSSYRMKVTGERFTQFIFVTVDRARKEMFERFVWLYNARCV